ncbi:MAG TPA: hypothetical protein VHZ24_08475 [Pirellulales bacterium]|jgi:hypothetical protein|nr:hypothetical protein [Pirellulales bacterium]
MNTAALLVALSTVGIDYGWEPADGGGIQYIVQIDPRMFDAMKNGGAVSSDLPQIPGGIRGYRVVVGTGPLPHQGEPLPQEPAGGPALAPSATTPTQPSIEAAPPANAEASSSPSAQRTFAPAESIAPPSAAVAMTTPKPTLDEPHSTTAAAHVDHPVGQSSPLAEKAALLTLIGLFASLGGNVYLGLVTWTQRLRFGRLVRQVATFK